MTLEGLEIAQLIMKREERTILLERNKLMKVLPLRKRNVQTLLSKYGLGTK